MTHSRKARMEDIAAEAGVSKSTVSRALRNDRRISAETRDRVAAAARKLDYRVNPLVATLMINLRSSRPADESPVVAFLIPARSRRLWLGHDVYAEYLDGARLRCEQLGFRIETFILSDYGLSIAQLDRVLYSRGIRGVVVGPPDDACHGRDAAWPAFWHRYAFGLISFHFPDAPMHRASNHHFFSALTAQQALADQGYRRIGLIVTENMDRRLNRQVSSAAAAFSRDLPPGAPRIPPLIRRAFTRKNVLRWYETHRPDALFAVDAVLGQVQEWLGDIDIRAPRDVGLASMHTHAGLGMAGIDQHSRQIGAAAADLVVGQLQRNESGIPDHPHLVLIAGSWVDGPTAPGPGVAVGRECRERL